MERKNKKDYNYKPRFKAGDIIIRNDQAHDSLTKAGITQYVNPYHKAFDDNSTLTISYINISEFSNFILKGYVFKEQQHSFDSKIVDIEYDLYEDVIRYKKINELKKKCINQNTRKVM
jgi:hypothetical protein